MKMATTNHDSKCSDHVPVFFLVSGESTVSANCRVIIEPSPRISTNSFTFFIPGDQEVTSDLISSTYLLWISQTRCLIPSRRYDRHNH
ncbi:hypothetical protein BS17DRAFT_790867 [Gyrodon lividus]|nr:hypothetical protein BS17DRAFT_790867 [Gyrodon lividus]